jgi:Fe-S-cluster-containing dehydrogenase component
MAELPDHKWTMVVDLDKCTGCNACVVACHAENNVPIVTEDEVINGRAMHWMRVERYWSGEWPDISSHYIPIMCQQCENAPCEAVCPVYATLHSERENLNLQVYNRCVGTRYCQNNDPYKVRFFNFYDPMFEGLLVNQLNPDVTVRTAGVMEKCTFCVQRIRRSEETALVEGRTLQDGEVVPACVQSCPSTALQFGDLNNPDAKVTQLVDNNGQQFKLLDNLGTKPQVVYLKAGRTTVSV